MLHFFSFLQWTGIANAVYFLVAFLVCVFFILFLFSSTIPSIMNKLWKKTTKIKESSILCHLTIPVLYHRIQILFQSTKGGVLSALQLKGLPEAIYTGRPRTVHCTHLQEKYWFYPQILEYIQNKISYLVSTAGGQHISKYTLLKSLQAATFWLVISIYTISTGQRTEQHLIKLRFF